MRANQFERDKSFTRVRQELEARMSHVEVDSVMPTTVDSSSTGAVNGVRSRAGTRSRSRSPPAPRPPPRRYCRIAPRPHTSDDEEGHPSGSSEGEGNMIPSAQPPNSPTTTPPPPPPPNATVVYGRRYAPNTVPTDRIRPIFRLTNYLLRKHCFCKLKLYTSLKTCNI